MIAPERPPPPAAPAPGTATPLVDGVHWVRLPVPGKLHHINVWLLEDDGGWTLVDTGMDVPEARAAWDGVLSEYLGGRPLRRIICTHHNPDHAGLAAWLAARHGAKVRMSAREAELLADLYGAADNPGRQREFIEAFARAGHRPPEAEQRVLSAAGLRRILSGVPDFGPPLADGEELRIGAHQWRVRLTAGHTEAQVLLEAPEPGLLIAADQVLPRITSNVGVYPWHPVPNPLAAYLDSLAPLAELPARTLVLPSHGDVFADLKGRVAELQAHHHDALARVRALVDAPTTPRELSERLFRPDLDPLNRMLAVGEAHGNLAYLAALGQLVADTDAAGVCRYRPTPGPATGPST